MALSCLSEDRIVAILLTAAYRQLAMSRSKFKTRASGARVIGDLSQKSGEARAMDMQRVFVHDLLSAVRAHITTKLRARSETANGGLPFMLAACQIAIYSIITMSEFTPTGEAITGRPQAIY